MDSRRLLRRSLREQSITRVVGVHNALGARVVERTGFDGVWVSGLEVSASFGLPDVGLLTMTELLGSSHYVSDAVSIPVIVDCDTGFGDEINVARLVREAARSGVAAVCIEDKVFPKRNSFMSVDQQLIDPDAFCRKLHAGQKAAVRDDVLLVARTEALVAGRGVDEALRRAEKYAEAGADAILVHSKDRNPDQVMEFLRLWQRRAPVVVVPTTYHEVSAKELEREGASMVIYANHGLRSAVQAVGETLAAIRDSGSTSLVEDRIAPVKEIFELQGTDSWLSFQQ
ncbi:isocitrate lyase/phosphoenolpyruvate mutase family protein [Streptomyces sp. NL15-2K]|nr:MULTISPECIES: isocitrate lyase/phosphoenolpyruvate mutase family protein [Actinomycetes]WKX10515.1 isocitrate lyase/phosphoenolpyruvate mutase family protein [Kutzneria buriramensis]